MNIKAILATSVPTGVAVAAGAVTIAAAGFTGYALSNGGLFPESTGTTSSSPSPILRTSDPIEQNVLVVIYDTHEMAGHQDYIYNNPVGLSRELEDQMEEASRPHGYDKASAPKEIDLKIIDTIVHEKEVPQTTNKNTQALEANYNVILQENNICDLVNANRIDEVWLWADRTGALSVASLAGHPDEIFPTNYGGIEYPECEHPVILMGFNYERNVDMAMRNYARRAEDIVSWVLDGKPRIFSESGSNYWEYDGRMNGSTLEDGELTHCGNVNWPPNADDEFDVRSTKVVESDCEDWNPQHTGDSKSITCDAWGCNESGFTTWWFQNMPARCNKLTTIDGDDMPNWWWHIMKLKDSEPVWTCKEQEDDGTGPTEGKTDDLRDDDDSDDDDDTRYAATGAGLYGPIVQKVLVVIYDPLIDNPPQEWGYWSPYQQMVDYENSIQMGSSFHNYKNEAAFQEIDFQVVDVVVYKEESPLIDRNGNGEYDLGDAHYEKIIADNDICGRKNRKEIDEVWLWASVNARYWEGIMAGKPGETIFINGYPIEYPECQTPVAIMGFSVNNTFDYGAMHNFDHRAEDTIAYFLDGHTHGYSKPGENFFEYDGRLSHNAPDPNAQHEYCGNCHFTHNSNRTDRRHEYNWFLENPIATDCQNWSPQHTGPLEELNCEAWGCSHWGFTVWWLQNMPGRCSDLTTLEGEPMPNWWWYLMKFHEPYEVGVDWECPGETPPVDPPADPCDCEGDECEIRLNQ